MAVHSGTIFQQGDYHDGLPKLVQVLSETVDSPSYHWRGTQRTDQSYFFQYSKSGTGMLRYGDKLYSLKPGTAIFARVNDPALEYFYPEHGDEPWHFFFCDLEGESLYAMAAEICRKFGHYYELRADVPILSNLYDFSRQPLRFQEMSNAESASLCLELLAALASCGEETTPLRADNLIEQALQFIQVSIRRNINASDVARAVGVSREHLSREFKAHTGMTPYQIITDQKLSLASTYLRETSLPIQEVAQSVGIPAHYFSNWFRKHKGVSPGTLRKARTR